MKEKENMMRKFEFLIGNWHLEYKVPKSVFSEPTTGKGTGTFKRALNNKYVYFDYSYSLTTDDGAAHAIFAWDDKTKIFRFWWFESSGNFTKATCNFVSDNILFLNWDDSLLKQTFKKVNQNKVILRMEHPNSKGEYELILEVILTRKELS